MRQIRTGVFETNSSSTHSICISKKKPTFLPSSIKFSVGEYGWENDSVEDTASYLYTGIIENEKTDCLDMIKSILQKHGVQCEFETPAKDKYGYTKGYIDHSGELVEFIDDVCNDEDKLLRYLFGDSVIYTGNDNSCDENSMCYCAEEFIWTENGNVPNPNHNDEEYEYYFKGN